MKNKITVIIKELERCAKQNESEFDVGATAVAGEQRRMIKILKRLRKED